jgi:hypothetical protein
MYRRSTESSNYCWYQPIPLTILFLVRSCRGIIGFGMNSRPVTFHEHFPCTVCGYGCETLEKYEQHLAKEHLFSKRKTKASLTDSLRRHSMCRDCWNSRYKGKSSVGHEVPQRFRRWEKCCFCGNTHKDGIVAHTPPDRRDLLCRQ